VTAARVQVGSAADARTARLLARVGTELGIELRFVPGAQATLGVPVRGSHGVVHGALCWSGPLDVSRLELVHALAAVAADELEREERSELVTNEVDDPWAGEDERSPADEQPSREDGRLGSFAPARLVAVGGLGLVSWGAIGLAAYAGGALSLVAWALVALAAYALYLLTAR
jgi:hypothetical protein